MLVALQVPAAAQTQPTFGPFTAVPRVRCAVTAGFCGVRAYRGLFGEHSAFLDRKRL